MIDFLKIHIDHIIFAVLGLMSLIMVWKTIERTYFYHKLNLDDYADIHLLDNALERGLTPIYTVGANAPYVGLLGTVIGVLITFYDISQQGGQIEVGKIMLGLALALKATALGICIAIPAIISYNLLTNAANVQRRKWASANSLHSIDPENELIQVSKRKEEDLRAEVWTDRRIYQGGEL